MSVGVSVSESSLGGGQIGDLQKALEFLYPSLPIFVGVCEGASSFDGGWIGWTGEKIFQNGAQGFLLSFSSI